MKIVNRTYSNIVESESTIQKTPVTKLAPTTSLNEGALMHIVQNVGDPQHPQYESKRITIDDFKQKIYESVQNTFKTKYWETHELISRELGTSYKHDSSEETNAGERPAGTSFKDLMSYLAAKDDIRKESGEDLPIYAPEEIDKADPDGFVDHIYFDFDLIKRYMVVKNGDIELSINELTERVDELDSYFAPNMSFATTMLDNNVEVAYTSSSVNHNLTENEDYCQMSIESGNKISNEWTCPESGNLVIYGWLDSTKCLNNKATPDAFCVIEANINNNWEIISVCPVEPAKSITYVGFNLMVKKNLVIRARTGFICGAKSSQFPNEQDGYDTLANSRANGFKCMIYFKEKGLYEDDNT